MRNVTPDRTSFLWNTTPGRTKGYEQKRNSEECHTGTDLDPVEHHTGRTTGSACMFLVKINHSIIHEHIHTDP